MLCHGSILLFEKALNQCSAAQDWKCDVVNICAPQNKTPAHSDHF